MGFPDSLNNKARGLARTALKLSELDATRSKELSDIQKRLADSTNEGRPVGINFWWRSEYLIQRTQRWTSSLKMFISRVMSVETNVNDENKLGAFLCDGVIWFRVTGDEYNNIQPVLDWRRIRGVTGVDTDDPVKPKLKTDYKLAGSFVGAAIDSNFGTAAMDFKRDDLNIKKGWFFLPFGIVALDYDKNKTSKKYFTGINQTKLRGNIYFWNNSKNKSEGKDFNGRGLTGIWHDNIGYITGNNKNIVLASGERKSKWTDIRNMGVPKDEVKLQVFLLYLTNQGNASYEYKIIPGVTPDKFESY